MPVEQSRTTVQVSADGTGQWLSPKYLYFGLVTVDLCVICLFLAFSSYVLDAFLESNATNRMWIHQEGVYSDLSAAANDSRKSASAVIDAQNLEAAKRQLDESVRSFRERLDAARAVAQQRATASQQADLQRRFTRMSDGLRRLERESDQIIRLMETQQNQQAAALVPVINDIYAQLVEDLSELTQSGRSQFDLRYEAQFQEILHLRTWQWGLAAGSVLIVGGIFFYGQRFTKAISKQIAEAHQQREVLAEKEARLATIVDTAADGIVTMNAQGMIETCNAATLKLFARPKSEIVGTPLFLLMEEFDEQAEAAGHLTLSLLDVNSLIGTKRELRGNRPDGSKFYIELAVAAVSFNGRRVITGIIHDVTERRQLETTLKQHRIAAEAATEAKSQFLANMSHEIRTPMTAIIGYADLLLEPGQAADERDRCIHTVRRNADHLLTLINDILDVSKIDAGKMTVEKIPLSPCLIVGDVASLMRVRALDKNIGFEVVYDGPVPAEISGDPVRLRQILLNLVGNAIKFTKSGQVRIHACGKDLASTKPTMCFRVFDSGIGLTPEQLGRLFKPFTQADYSTTRQFGGTGLGLTISKQLVNMMGGEISVSSVPGLGSCFEFHVPTGPLENVRIYSTPTEIESVREVQKSPVVGEAGRLTARILLAEDGADNYRLISYHLRKAGATVVHAENGQIAVDKALEARELNQPFDVVLMDMQMPVMDGYTATSRLRSAGYTTPIIALTANAMTGDREKCLKAGCTDFLTKPINAPLMIRTVGEYTHKSSASLSEFVTVTTPQLTQEPQPQVSITTPTTDSTITAASDSEPIISEFADDEDMAEIIAEFLGGLSERVSMIETALTNRQFEQLASVSHQLKGAAGGYGYPQISEITMELEKLGHAGVMDQSLESTVIRLGEMCRRAIAGHAGSTQTSPPTSTAAATLDETIQELALETLVPESPRDNDLDVVGAALLEAATV